jgi:hypothetical protein
MSEYIGQVDAVAMYGSQVRGDADLLSDADMIIVSPDTGALIREKGRLEARGFSCSTYTWKRLYAMAKRGSLFIEHLKKESLILMDRGNVFRSFLDGFEAQADYSADIEDTKNVFALTQYTTVAASSYGWAFDILAVAVRNMGVLLLANQGRYSFSYRDILCALQQDGLLSQDDVYTLNKLRLFKARYRAGRYDLLPGRDALEDIQRVISRCFQADFDSRVLRHEEFASKMLQGSATHSNKYCRLRLAEGAVMGLQSFVDNGWQGQVRFRKIISNQNQYGLFYSDLSHELRAEAEKIIIHANADSIHVPRVDMSHLLAMNV